MTATTKTKKLVPTIIGASKARKAALLTRLDAALDEAFSYLNTPKRGKTPFVVCLHSNTKNTFGYAIYCKFSGRGWRDPGDRIDIPVSVREQLFDALHDAYDDGCVPNSAPGTGHPKKLERYTFAIHSNGLCRLWNGSAKEVGYSFNVIAGNNPIHNFVGDTIRQAVAYGKTQAAERAKTVKTK